MVSQHLLLLFCLLFLLIKEGRPDSSVEPLECYSCSSEIKEQKADCEKPGPTTPKATCVGNQTMCRKIEQQIYYNGEDHTRTLRQCATSGELGECLERTGTYRYKTWYCQCKGKLCNNANKIASPITFIFALISLLGFRFL